MATSSQIWLRRLSKLTVASTLFLIFAGALVKSHEVGLSVPDWPTTYGKQMFAFPLSEMVGGIFYEHGHRMVATTVGFFMLVLAVWLGFVEPRIWVKRLGFTALALVIIQGLFGGITVLFFLPPAVSVIHGILAQTFFILTIVLAYSLSAERKTRKTGKEIDIPNMKTWVIVMGSAVYIQLILGALMRHTASGMAIPDFPTMGGFWLPPFNETMMNTINDHLFEIDRDMVSLGQVILHFMHRTGGAVVTGIIFYSGLRFIKTPDISPKIRRTLIGIVGLVLVQFTLGAFTIWTERAPYIASYHVVTGAALLGGCTLLALRVFPLKGMKV